MEKTYKIEKYYQTNDTSILAFSFEGKANKNSNIKKVENLLDICFENSKTYKDMVKNIAWIRTILKDFEEVQMSLHLSKKDKAMRMEYKNKELQYCEVQEPLNTGDVLNVTYSRPFTFHAFVIRNSLSPAENMHLEDYNQNINKIMQEIIELEKNIPVIELKEQDKTIWLFYKAFYKENPDFSKKDTALKIQTMLCILLNFNITMGYGFDQILLDFNMPFSVALQCDLDRIIPLGEVKEVEEIVPLTLKVTKEIESIGEFVRNYTNNDLNKLIKLSTIIYCSRYDLDDSTNINQVAEFSKYSTSDVEESLNLIRKINKRLQSKEKL